MIYAASGKKLVLARATVNALDVLHRAIIEVLADRGEITIVDSPHGTQVTE